MDRLRASTLPRVLHLSARIAGCILSGLLPERRHDFWSAWYLPQAAAALQRAGFCYVMMAFQGEHYIHLNLRDTR